MRHLFGWIVVAALVPGIVAGCQRTKPPDEAPPPVEKPRMPETPAPAYAPRVLTIPPASGKAEYLVVLLHGVGATADSFFPIAQALAPALPNAEFLVPDGFQPFDGAPSGRQWFSIRGVTDENRPPRVEQGAAPLNAWIDQELSRRGLGGDRLIVLGFSQGAIMAHWLALRRNPAPAAIVSIAGLLAVEGRPVAPKPSRVLLVHGAADTRMPVSLAHEAASELKARGVDVKLQVIPGLAHGIDARALDQVKQFLVEVTGQP